MPRKQVASLTYLGRSTPAPATPDEAILDRIPNRHPDTPFVARFSVPEFTVLCAVTGQPDFAHLVIDYVPRNWLIESKSLKLYLASYRNQNGFHEDCTIRIGKRLVEVLQPTYLRIGGYWYQRPSAQKYLAARPGCGELSRPGVRLALGLGQALCLSGVSRFGHEKTQDRQRRSGHRCQE